MKETDRKKKRSRGPKTVYTLGYQGLSLSDFFKKLDDAGVRRVVDVRNNPFSFKKGFSKSPLNKICEESNVEYMHVPELGIPSKYRSNLETEKDYRTLFNFYIKSILSSTKESQERLAALLQEIPSVLVCFEKDPHFCHRSRLADAISRSNGFNVVHLQ